MSFIILRPHPVVLRAYSWTPVGRNELFMAVLGRPSWVPEIEPWLATLEASALLTVLLLLLWLLTILMVLEGLVSNLQK